MLENAIDLVKSPTSYTLIAALFYVALIAIMNVFAGLAVVHKRMTHQVKIGHGDNHAVMRYARLHGNLAENTSPTLGVLLGLGIIDAHYWWVHAVGLCFVIGRAFHAYSMASSHLPILPRQIGMGLTWTALLTGATGLIVYTI